MDVIYHQNIEAGYLGLQKIHVMEEGLFVREFRDKEAHVFYRCPGILIDWLTVVMKLVED
jgi:hypothetical protein